MFSIWSKLGIFGTLYLTFSFYFPTRLTCGRCGLWTTVAQADIQYSMSRSNDARFFRALTGVAQSNDDEIAIFVLFVTRRSCNALIRRPGLQSAFDRETRRTCSLWWTPPSTERRRGSRPFSQISPSFVSRVCRSGRHEPATVPPCCILPAETNKPQLIKH